MGILKRLWRVRWIRYGTLLLLGLSVVWGPTLMYLKNASDVYRSSASLLIPGSGVGSSLNLDNVGQATTSVASAYSSSSVDPKVNYKSIMTSSTVLRDAAERAGMTLPEFGEPRIKLVDQTSIIAIVFESDTAEKAHLKSKSLVDSLEAELTRLRADERERVREGNTQQLEEYQLQMSEAQTRLLEFQVRADTVSAEQLGTLLRTIEGLRARRNELDLELAAGRGRADALSEATGVDAGSSASIVRLQQDLVLRELVGNYSKVNAEYLDNATILGPNNPKMALLRSRRGASEGALRRRAEEVLGYADDALVDRFLPVGDGGSDLHGELVALHAELAADTSERDALDTLIVRLESTVQERAKRAARFEELERGYRVAETVFLTALAKIDLGRSDIFASYPMLQVLVAPTLPDRPVTLHRLFAVLGAVVGSGFILLSLGVLWKRESLLRKLQRKK